MNATLAALAWPECFEARSCYYAVLTVQAEEGQLSQGYFTEPRNWLNSPAGEAVRAKAATWTPEREVAA